MGELHFKKENNSKVGKERKGGRKANRLTNEIIRLKNSAQIVGENGPPLGLKKGSSARGSDLAMRAREISSLNRDGGHKNCSVKVSKEKTLRTHVTSHVGKLEKGVGTGTGD